MNAKGQTIRDKIITIADDLFYRNGYNNTSFSYISEAVGISRGNFYYHFKTKDDILAAVIEHRKTIINDLLQKWTHEHDSPRERLCCYIDMLVRLQDEIYEHGCSVGSVCAELIKLDNINQDNAIEMISLFRQWFAQQITALGYDQPKADELAMHLISRTQGISFCSKILTTPPGRPMTSASTITPRQISQYSVNLTITSFIT